MVDYRALTRMENNWPFPSGMRFRPTDRELILDYLGKKIKNLPLPCDFLINNVRFYDYTPHQLAAAYDDRGQKEWYFFTVINRKWKGGNRANRVLTTGDGYWKASKGGPVRDGDVDIGFKRNLVFYQGNNKTNWLMNEYYIENPHTGNAATNTGIHLDLVLCKIYNKDHKKGGHLPAPHQCPASAPPLQNSDVLSDNIPESSFLQPPLSTPPLQNSDVLSDDILESHFPQSPPLQNLDFLSDNIPGSSFLQSPLSTPPLQNWDVLSNDILESHFPQSPASAPPQSHHSMYSSSDLPESYFPQLPASAPPPSHHSIYWSSAIPDTSPQSPESSVLSPAQHSMYRSDAAITEKSFPESPASVLPQAHLSMYCTSAIPKSECPQSPVSVLPPAQPRMYCSNAIQKSECPQSPTSVLPPA